MSINWYVYRHPQGIGGWEISERDPQPPLPGRREAIGVAGWAGIEVDPAEVRPIILPGGPGPALVAWFVSPEVLISPVNLSWMPASTRAGMFQRVKGPAPE